MSTQDLIVIDPQVVTGEVQIRVEKEIHGVVMGILSDGTSYLTQRGLARLCGVDYKSIDQIEEQWTDSPLKDRIVTIQEHLAETGYRAPRFAVRVIVGNVVHCCIPAEVCTAVLSYYSFGAGSNCTVVARKNLLKLSGAKLRDEIYKWLGEQQRVDQFQPVMERWDLNIALARKGIWTVFVECVWFLQKMVAAKIPVGYEIVPDISIGRHWSTYWEAQHFDERFGKRQKTPHYYPASHPQSKSNPQDVFAYPLSSLGAFREWLQVHYVDTGLYRTYLKRKEKAGALPAVHVRRALEAVGYKQIG